jgi:exodeoxyribonuclease V alpha subunit
VDTEAKIVRVITELVTQRFPARGYDPIWDIQVISPVNERTLMSCKNLNSALQEKLNSNPAVEGTPFRVGDKAIQIKNERIDAKDEHGMTEETIIVNGDLCQILDVDKRRITAKFFDPVRIVNLKTKENNLLLAYAITCHRYQGSEAPVVIIPVYKSFNFFVTRDWIYTAISRAKQICVTVGQFTAVGHAIGLEVSNKRVTKLEERLRKHVV